MSIEFIEKVLLFCPCCPNLDAQLTDQGKYSCHLHHHYCGLHERREFQVTVEAPLLQTTAPSEEKGNTHQQRDTMCVCVHICSFPHDLSFPLRLLTLQRAKQQLRKEEVEGRARPSEGSLDPPAVFFSCTVSVSGARDSEKEKKSAHTLSHSLPYTSTSSPFSRLFSSLKRCR